MKNLLGHEIGAGAAGRLIGACLVGPKHASELVSIDEHGELWKLAPRGHGALDRKSLIRFCIERGVLAYGDMQSLNFGLKRGTCIGLLAQVAPRVASRWRSA